MVGWCVYISYEAGLMWFRKLWWRLGWFDGGFGWIGGCLGVFWVVWGVSIDCP